MMEDENKTIPNFIDEISEILNKSKHFHTVRIEGDITNIVIEKPKEDKKDVGM